MERSELRRLKQKRKLLVKRLGRSEEFLRGSVVRMRRCCVRPACRKCASGERHPTWVLTVSRKGKTHTVYLGEKRVEAARRMVGSYRRLMEWVEEIGRINLLLLKGRVGQAKGASDGPKGRGP